MSFFAFLVLIFLLILLVYSIFKGFSVQNKKPIKGDSGIIGSSGRCVKVYSEKEGKIFVNGELWDARFSGVVKENDKIIVINVIESIPIVKKVTDSEENII